ncbi:SDR family oxidoreductase [Thalassotalea sp. HSM 43]|uniref:SDR family NAD(P)-dependent oxidoreductase n=1 Tax=Thalassotalea sp. HSM 43 TaxID=2552945 RepID=UPI001081E430|nr:SDR family oxidoreductase [Thalassotalea sp. HSM 43]QBY05881.1 SDR family oxidoreductase [Thalassotalea sp. HSM 43]
MELKNKVALVTGASSGVGAQTATQLAQNGVRVVINYANNKQGALKTQQHITSLGGQAEIYQADVRDQQQCTDLVEFAVATYQRLDIVINNAGYTQFVPHHELDLLSDDVWQQTLATNLLGPFYISRAAVPHLAISGGEIVMTSSIAGLTAHGSSIAYCASKSGLNNLTKTLAKTLGPQNIRVNAICPGLIDDKWAESGWGDNWQAAKDYTLAHSAIKRISQSSDVAASILAILIGSDNMTGQVIRLDSGLTL